MLFFIVSALLMLASMATEFEAQTLEEVVEAACGKWGLRTCGLCLGVYCFGACITFLIIIGDQSDRCESRLSININHEMTFHTTFYILNGYMS